MEVISNTDCDLPDLQFPSYKVKYVKMSKKCLSRVFMGLKHNFDLDIKSSF